MLPGPQQMCRRQMPSDRLYSETLEVAWGPGPCKASVNDSKSLSLSLEALLRSGERVGENCLGGEDARSFVSSPLIIYVIMYPMRRVHHLLLPFLVGTDVIVVFRRQIFVAVDAELEDVQIRI